MEKVKFSVSRTIGFTHTLSSSAFCVAVTTTLKTVAMSITVRQFNANLQVSKVLYYDRPALLIPVLVTWA